MQLLKRMYIYKYLYAFSQSTLKPHPERSLLFLRFAFCGILNVCCQVNALMGPSRVVSLSGVEFEVNYYQKLKWITIRIYQIYHLESRWHNSFQIATFWELCHLLSLRYIYRCCLGSLHCSTRVCRLISMYDVWLARCLSYQHIMPYNTIFVTTCHHVINERVGLLRGIRTPSVDACTNAFVAFVNLFSTTYSKVSFPEVSIDTVVKKSKCMYTLTLAHQF